MSERRKRSRGSRIGLAIGLTALVSTTLVAFDSGTAQAATNWHGCPQYNVCLYRHANYVGDRGLNVPDNVFSDCGSYHNISRYYHDVSIVNRQAAQSTNDGRALYYTGHGTGLKYSTGPSYSSPHSDLYIINSVRACNHT